MRIKRVRRPRVLRHFICPMAYRDHKCNQCQHRIDAGDEYEAYVMVFGRKLWVNKYHIICPPKWHDDEEKRVKEDQAAHEREKWQQPEKKQKERAA